MVAIKDFQDYLPPASRGMIKAARNLTTGTGGIIAVRRRMRAQTRQEPRGGLSFENKKDYMIFYIKKKYKFYC